MIFKRSFLFIMLSTFQMNSLIAENYSFLSDSKTRAILRIACYGTVGGALLGVASLAFTPKIRSIPVGASLGLYSGLLFGGYIMMIHYLKGRGYLNTENMYYETSALETPLKPDLMINFNYQF